MRSALVLTVTAGALTGALDLWSLRVTHHPVPVDHHRGHALAQVFGFVGLLVVGLSLRQARARGVAPLTIFGAALLVVGRLGALVPGSRWLGLLGGVALLAGLSLWAVRVARSHFLLASAGWWWLAALTALSWQAGQTFGWPLAQAVPLDVVWSMGLLGGAGSWLWSLFDARGDARHRLFLVWQPVVALVVGAHWVQQPWFDVLGAAALAVGVALAWWTFSLSGAQQVGFGLVAVSTALGLWSALGGTPVYLRDATRHCLTFGVSLLMFGFVGRLLSELTGSALRWPRAFEAGLFAIGAAAVLRLGELFDARAGLALAGASGGVALLGVVLVAAALWKTTARSVSLRS